MAEDAPKPKFGHTQKVTKETRGKSRDNIYREKSAHGQFHEKKESGVGNASSVPTRKGPIRAPTFVRQSVRWDYQPDSCQEYKETDACGFGDSCKSLHGSTDYKHGLEMEREWQEGRYAKKDSDQHVSQVSDDADELPFKCLTCGESFKCKHYLCEKCALDHYRKTQKCYLCQKNSGGFFDPAKEMIVQSQDGNQKRAHREDDDQEPSSSDEKVLTKTILEEGEFSEASCSSTRGGFLSYYTYERTCDVLQSMVSTKKLLSVVDDETEQLRSQHAGRVQQLIRMFDHKSSMKMV